jgi:tagatose-1,6-bisphosphate aldolase
VLGSPEPIRSVAERSETRENNTYSHIEQIKHNIARIPPPDASGILVPPNLPMLASAIRNAAMQRKFLE